MAEIHPHPALKAAVPAKSDGGGWMGDDWFHNGAFRVSGIDYVSACLPRRARERRVRARAGDDYTRYLEALPSRISRDAPRQNISGVRKFLEPGLHGFSGRWQEVGRMAPHAADVPTLSSASGPGRQLWRPRFIGARPKTKQR